jgi:orotate phosphoribosyltransferase-like protein
VFGLNPNPERNEKIYTLWKEGHTIEEISLLTGIPRSTVGYYIKKFKKQQANRKDLDFEDLFTIERKLRNREREKAQALPSAVAKVFSFKDIIEVMKKGDSREAFYYLATIKLLIDLFKHFQLTPNERQALIEVLKPSSKSIEPVLGFPIKLEKKGKTLKEIADEINKTT